MRIADLSHDLAAFRAEADVPTETRWRVDELVRVFNACAPGNAVKRRYYEGHIRLSEVNLGLALPNGMANLEVGCAWGEKAVDVLAARSMFDGYVSEDGTSPALISSIVEANQLLVEYGKATRNELTYGCDFATLATDRRGGCRISFHSPETAAALWDDEAGRLMCGLAVLGVRRAENQWRRLEATTVAYYDEQATWIFRRDRSGRWYGERRAHNLRRPLMEALTWNATSVKPFGRSRLKAPVRNLIKSYVRTVANATIGLEFSTTPQKYLLGLTDTQYEAVLGDKFRLYAGAMLASTGNPETGQNPTAGQFPQGTLEPHIAMIRMLATQFSAATGLSATDVGIVNDANPSSSDAILAQTQTLVLTAEQLNAGNGHALREIALMAQALARGVRLDELTDEERGVIPHFKSPAMPSVAVTADAAVKIATSRPSFASTDVFMEMLGFSQADIRRIKAQEARARGLAVLAELEAE